MKKIILLLFIVAGLVGCFEDSEKFNVKYIGKIKGKKTYEYTIDSCQYIRSNYKEMLHKGNCNNPIHKNNLPCPTPNN